MVRLSLHHSCNQREHDFVVVASPNAARLEIRYFLLFDNLIIMTQLNKLFPERLKIFFFAGKGSHKKPLP